jgi:hypothetical protein
VVGWVPLTLSVRSAEMRLAASVWGTRRMAHGRSRSGIVLAPLASGGRREYLRPALSCRSETRREKKER